MGDRDLIISSVSNGTTYPAAGTTSYTGVTSVIVYAIPNRGYKLSGWTFNSVAQTSKSTRYTAVLPAVATYTLTPAFDLEYTVSNNQAFVFTNLKQQIQRLTGQSSLAVTLYALSLGSQDTDTGLPAKTYTTSSIDALIVSNTAKPILATIGTAVNLDAVAYTTSYLRNWDKLVLASGKQFFVDSVMPVLDGSGQLLYYEAQLKEIKML